jgi:hypothetical protein
MKSQRIDNQLVDRELYVTANVDEVEAGEDSPTVWLQIADNQGTIVGDVELGTEHVMELRAVLANLVAELDVAEHP